METGKKYLEIVERENRSMTIPLTELGVTNSRLGTPMYQIMDAFTHREIARELRQLVSGPTAIMVNPQTGEGVDIELMLRTRKALFTDCFPNRILQWNRMNSPPVLNGR